jgi:nitrogen fixation/metabolism regulation signal transduction histidine kinase
MKLTLSLTNKYLLLSLLILFFIFGLVFSSFILTEKIKGESQKINLASQQHMQLLRISSLMHFFVNPSPLHVGISGSDSTQKIIEEAQRYETVLYGLQNGNSGLNLHPISPDDKQSLAQLNLLLKLWNESQKPLLQTIINSPVSLRQDFCTSCHAAFREQIGEVNVLAAKISDFYNQNLDSFKKFRFFALLFSPILLLGMTWFIRLKLILPIKRLKEANDRIELGDFETRLPVLSEDEIGYLTRSHNRMSETLKQLFQENEENLSQLTFVNQEMRTSIKNLDDEKIFSESIIRSLSSGLMVIDLEGMIVTANPNGIIILNLFDLDPVGKSLASVLGDKTFQAMTDIHGNLSHISSEIAIRSLKGDKRSLGFTATNRNDADGNRLGIIISFSDITEDKYLHKEMEKMNRLSTVAEIATAVAHEVRNPLAGIKTMAQSIDESLNENDDNKECITRIIRQVNRLNNLLTDFFGYARPNKPRKVKSSLEDIISETKHLINNKLYKMNIELKEKYVKDLPCIKVDPDQIQQVFLNLILNSIEAFNKNGIIEIITETIDETKKERYRLTYPELKEDSNYVAVHFRDTGPGLDDDIAEKIFEPFFTTKHTGSGMGLSIVYRILKENNATIHLEDNVDEGVAYIIFFETG